MTLPKTLALAVAACCLSGTGHAVITFDELLLPAEDFSFPDDGNTDGGVGANAPWISGGATFDRFVDDEWASWSGFTYSNATDTTTPGFFNQGSVITGAAYSGDNFALGYDSATVTFAAGQFPVSARITNSTYAYQYIVNGLDGFAPEPDPTHQYGDTDYFLLKIEGFDGTATSTGVIDFYLADYRPATDLIVDSWELVDLSSLGSSTRSLTFSFESTDTGSFGINTPTYFALDDLVAIPEPGRASLLAVFGLAAVLRRRR